MRLFRKERRMDFADYAAFNRNPGKLKDLQFIGQLVRPRRFTATTPASVINVVAIR